LSRFPIVSVIIPNYNNSKYLNECLDSVLNQTYGNFEIVIVDDCSTDNSLEILQEYSSKHDRIKLIQNKKNQMVSKTRHIGIENSKGEYLTTLDSDDLYVDKNKIEEEMDLILSKGNNIIAYSGIVRINKTGEKTKTVMNNRNAKEGNIFKEIITRNCAIPRDFTFSKKLYYEVGGYDFNILLYEDWDLKIRLSRYFEFLYTGKIGIAYRSYGAGLSSVSTQEHIVWLKFIFNKNSSGISNKKELSVIFYKNILQTFFKKIVRDILNRILSPLGISLIRKE